MKKYIILVLILIGLAPLLGAQTHMTFRSDDVQKVYNGVAGDTLNASRLLVKNIFVNKDYLYHVNVQIDADSAGNGANITAKLRGSYDNATWSDIGSTVTWYVVGADTTFSINSLAVTDTYAAINITADTVGMKYYPAKTTMVPAQTVTRGVNGLMYPYLQVYFLGASGADMKLERLIVRIIQANK